MRLLIRIALLVNVENKITQLVMILATGFVVIWLIFNPFDKSNDLLTIAGLLALRYIWRLNQGKSQL